MGSGRLVMAGGTSFQNFSKSENFFPLALVSHVRWLAFWLRRNVVVGWNLIDAVSEYGSCRRSRTPHPLRQSFYRIPQWRIVSLAAQFVACAHLDDHVLRECDNKLVVIDFLG